MEINPNVNIYIIGNINIHKSLNACKEGINEDVIGLYNKTNAINITLEYLHQIDQISIGTKGSYCNTRFFNFATGNCDLYNCDLYNCDIKARSISNSKIKCVGLSSYESGFKYYEARDMISNYIDGCRGNLDEDNYYSIYFINNTVVNSKIGLSLKMDWRRTVAS